MEYNWISTALAIAGSASAIVSGLLVYIFKQETKKIEQHSESFNNVHSRINDVRDRVTTLEAQQVSEDKVRSIVSDTVEPVKKTVDTIATDLKETNKAINSLAIALAKNGVKSDE